MRKFLLALLFIRIVLIATPTLAKWPLVPVNLLPDSSIELQCNLATAFNIKGFKLAIIEPLTVAPTATPAQILPTGSSRLEPNVSGGYTPYQSLSVVGPGTIWPGLGDAIVTNLPPGVHSFTLIVTDAASQTAAGTVSLTVTAANSSPTTTGIANQTASMGQSFSLNVAPFFTDAETPDGLIFTATNLPPGLSLIGSTISGSATKIDRTVVTITAVDPGGLATYAQFWLNVLPVIIEPLTVAPTATPAQILPTGSSRLEPNVSGGYTPYQSLSVVGPGTIWPGLGDAIVTNLPPGVHSFTLIVTDAASQTAAGIVSLTVNTPPVGCSSMYSLKAGSWTDVGVWSCGRLPTGTDIITLNHTINLPASYQGQALEVLYSLTGRLVMEAESKLRLSDH